MLVAASVVAGVAEAAVLALIAQIATAMANGDAAVHVELGSLHLDATTPVMFVAAFSFAAVRFALQVVVATLPARMATDAQADLRRGLFSAFVRASWEVQSRDRDGHLQELMTQHVDRATQVILVAANALSAGLMFLALTGSAVFVSAPIALIIFVVSAALFFALRPLAGISRRQARELSSASLDQGAGVSEAVRLAEEMHVYGTADAHIARLDTFIDRVWRHGYRTRLLQRLVGIVYQNLALLLIIGGLAVLYISGGERLAALGAVVLMLVRALSYGQQLQTAYQQLNELGAYISRVRTSIDLYARSTTPFGDQPLTRIDSLSFDDVTYAYLRNEPVLRGISFEIRRGEAIGIVGPSGGGKSTLVQLLLRLREPDSGLYSVNDQPAPHYRLDDWTDRVAYVGQEPRLLEATVAENIAYLRPIDRERIELAARQAHIAEEIATWEGNYDRPVGQRVDAVSGGQRQRLVLARALAGDPDLLILDEPTSALDLRSEVAIQETLENLKRDVTVVIVAHRMSTLAVCDRVLVLENGTVKAFDQPKVLRFSNDYFREAQALSHPPNS